MSAEQINDAIHSCLDRCQQADNQAAAIGALMHELRTSGEWSERDQAAVYSTAMRMLRTLAGHSGDTVEENVA